MKRDRTRMRSGAVLVAVLTCLLVAMALVFAGMQSLVRVRQETKNARLIQQTQLLVDAGVSHALKKLRASGSYRGEIWKPKVALLEGWIPIVEIREEHANKREGTDDRIFTVVAKLQSNAISMQAIQESFQFRVYKSEP